MLVNLQQGKYMITGIVSEENDLACYLARDAKKNEYIVNEIKSIELIEKYLPMLSGKSEQINCFTENSYLYFIARYYDGENTSVYLNNRQPDFRERLRMLEAFTFSLASFEEMPEIILQSLLKPENICVFRGELQSNCCLWHGCDKKPFELFRQFVVMMFSKEEIAKNKLLSMIYQKLSDGGYGLFTELYVDVRELVANYRKAPGIVSFAKSLWERYKPIAKIVLTVGVLVLAAVAVINLLTGNGASTAAASGTPIDHIGTVSIGGDSNESVYHEIQVREDA